MKTQLGDLYFGDYFKFDGKTYRADKPIRRTDGYLDGHVSCVDTETHDVTRFHIDTVVEKVNNNEM